MTDVKKNPAYAHLMDLGRGVLEQAVSVQRSALEAARQFVEGDSAALPLRARHEEWVRQSLEVLAPLYLLEEATRAQALRLQAGLFDLLDDALRGVTLPASERGRNSTSV
jgi:hypothetical protein